MRRWVWVLSVIALSCGRVDSHSDQVIETAQGGSDAEAGKRGGTTSVGTSGTGGSGRGGNEAGEPGGSGIATGGAVPPVAGAGGATSSNAGTGGAPIDDFPPVEGGAAPARDDETYDACGCGCCGAPQVTRCYYPDLGQDLGEVVREDEAAASSPSCANAGCAAGVHHVRCQVPDAEDRANYHVLGYMDSQTYLQVSRESQSLRCTRVTFAQPATPQENFPIELPQPGRISDSSDQSCTLDAAHRKVAIGAIGFLRKTAPQGCLFDFDFTLFFLAADGTADPVRFRGDGVAFEGMENGTCP